MCNPITEFVFPGKFFYVFIENYCIIEILQLYCFMKCKLVISNPLLFMTCIYSICKAIFFNYRAFYISTTNTNKDDTKIALPNILESMDVRFIT